MWLADVAGFVLALAIVTFLHLVIGEMAPKSWAIAHPERAAIILAIPMRMFMSLTRPVLVALNRAANWCVRKVGVDPVDELGEGQDSDALRPLVEHSAAAGALDPRYYRNLTTALELEKLTVGDIVSRTGQLSTVAADAGPAAIQAMSQLTGHQRILVGGDHRTVTGVVHVRDSLRAEPGATARDLMRPVLRLQPDIPVYRALHHDAADPKPPRDRRRCRRVRRAHHAHRRPGAPAAARRLGGLILSETRCSAGA